MIEILSIFFITIKKLKEFQFILIKTSNKLIISSLILTVKLRTPLLNSLVLLVKIDCVGICFGWFNLFSMYITSCILFNNSVY